MMQGNEPQIIRRDNAYSVKKQFGDIYDCIVTNVLNDGRIYVYVPDLGSDLGPILPLSTDITNKYSVNDTVVGTFMTSAMTSFVIFGSSKARKRSSILIFSTEQERTDSLGAIPNSSFFTYVMETGYLQLWNGTTWVQYLTTVPTGSINSDMIVNETIVNIDIAPAAAISHSKLANTTAGKVLLGATTTGVVTATTLSGDVTINGAGVTSISPLSIVNGDIADSTISLAKLASGSSAQLVINNSSGVPTYTTVSGDITISNTGVTAIGLLKVTNEMLAGSIADTKLSTISTAGKVSNSATTATSANTASAIVARDSSGNFIANHIAAGATGLTDAGSVSASGWFRSKGQTGWYSQDYGGGIYMIDTTWVRVYNNKNFYTNGTIRAESSVEVAGPSADGGWSFRPWTASGSYMSVATLNMTGSEYALLTDGTSTFISGGSGGSSYIRAGNNDATGQVQVSPSAVYVTGNMYLGSASLNDSTDYVARDSSNGRIHVKSSNRALKENIALISGALDTIQKLSPKTFNWKLTEEDNDSEYKILTKQTYKSMGFILEEVLDVSPELITWRMNPEDSSIYPGYWKIDDFIALSIQGVKELNEKVLVLESEIRALKEQK